MPIVEWLSRREGKFLGFYAGKNDIHPNPDKIQVVFDMSPPTTIKQIQHMNGRINALSKFISKTIEKCTPFFQLLKTTSKGRVTWSIKCIQVFKQLKKHLTSPPLLALPKPRFLYVATFDEAVNAVLVSEREHEKILV